MFIGGNETQEYFSLQLKKAFEKMGHEVFVYDYKHQWNTTGGLLRFCGNGNTVMVTFNFHGICGEEVFLDATTKRWFWEDLHIPCYNIIVDHPLYYHHFIEKVPEQYYQLDIDRNHDKYMRRYFSDINLGPFLPLAGTELNPGEKKMAIADRPIDICFAGNYSPSAHFDKYVNRSGEEYAAFYQTIINDLLENPDQTMEEAAEKRMIEEFGVLTEEEMKATMPSLCILDLIIRGIMRERAIISLIDNGIKVHIIGAGWEELPCKHPENMIRHGIMNSEGCLRIQSQSKICLNVMPWFKEGAHDRIFNTMLNGSVSLTDSSKYLDEVLTKDDAYFYSLREINHLSDMVGKLLADNEMMQSIADHGYETARKAHTWQQRAEVLHDFIEQS